LLLKDGPELEGFEIPESEIFRTDSAALVCNDLNVQLILWMNERIKV